MEVGHMWASWQNSQFFSLPTIYLFSCQYLYQVFWETSSSPFSVNVFIVEMHQSRLLMFKSISIFSKNYEGSEISPYFQESNFTHYHFMDAGREHKTQIQNKLYYSQQEQQPVSTYLHQFPKLQFHGVTKKAR